MAILDNLVDLTEITTPNDSFVSDSLRVGHGGRAMFTAHPPEYKYKYNIYMQVNISPTRPDGPWANLPYFSQHENVYWATSGVYNDLIPGTFVRMVVSLTDNVSTQDTESTPDSVWLRLILHTEALSGSQ